MDAKRMRFFRDFSIQNKVLVIILPLIVIPMLILATVGFMTASREAAKTSTRYLKQRENDLRTIAENPAIHDYFNNQSYGLTEEAEVYQHKLERSLKRFADRSNSIELIYPQVRFIDHRGQEAAKVVEGQIVKDRDQVAEQPYFAAIKRLSPGETYLSPPGPRMLCAMPVHQPGTRGREPVCCIFDHLVRQTHCERFLRLHDAAGEQHLQGTRKADHTSQKIGAAVSRHQSHFDEARTEFCTTAANPNVAHAGQVEPRAHGRSVDRSDDGFVEHGQATRNRVDALDVIAT